MLRPGAAPSWEFGHVSWLWLLFLAFSSGIFLVYPSSSPPHQEALCLVLAIAGISAAVFSSSSVRALAACLGPTIGLVTVTMIVRGATEQAAAVALAGGISVLVTLGLFQLFSEAARRDVERG